MVPPAAERGGNCWRSANTPVALVRGGQGGGSDSMCELSNSLTLCFLLSVPSKVIGSLVSFRMSLEWWRQRIQPYVPTHHKKQNNLPFETHNRIIYSFILLRLLPRCCMNTHFKKEIGIFLFVTHRYVQSPCDIKHNNLARASLAFFFTCSHETWSHLSYLLSVLDEGERVRNYFLLSLQWTS